MKPKNPPRKFKPRPKKSKVVKPIIIIVERNVIAEV